MSSWNIGICLVIVVGCGGGADGGSAPDARRSGVETDAPVPGIDAAVPADGRLADPPDAVATADARVPSPDAAAPPDVPPAPPDAAPPDARALDATTDPCTGVPLGGVCATAGRIDHCVVAEGEEPHVASIFCQPDETCTVTDGLAQCVLVAPCRDGDSECVSSTQIRRCSNGSWSTSSCSRACLGTPLGDFCGLDESTHAQTGTLLYQVRGPNDTFTNWGPLFLSPAQGFLAISARFLPDGRLLPIDAGYTTGGQNGGQFALQVATNPTVNDVILFLAAHPDATGRELAFALANPGLNASIFDYPVGAVGARPDLWFWGWAVAGLPQGSTLTITEAMGSGAARIFDFIRYISFLADARWPQMRRWRTIAWLGGGVTWQCGACMTQTLALQFGTVFGASIAFDGGPDQGYWADSVTAHELGHWAMASFGHVVGEGGPHFLGDRSSPGLAWSEGFATWFSSNARQSPFYVDKQNGTMFWFDIGNRQGGSFLWPYPLASAGLYQAISENEVAAMMWHLSDTLGFGSAPLDAALSSRRMTVPPFLRGYRTAAGVNTTFFADFLDALDCAGTPASSIDSATQPLTRFPYPSQSPLCAPQSPRAPATLHIDEVPAAPGQVALHARLERHGSWPYPVTIAFQTPPDALVGQSSADTIEIDLARVPAQDFVATADSRGPAGGFHAEARYRFGRPPTPASMPRRVGPRLRLGTIDLGSPIRGDVP